MTQRQFEHQVHQYQDRVYGYAYYMVGDPDEAADVTQEVLIRFWHHRETVDADRTLPWLLRVTRNAAVDALRKRKAYRKTVLSDSEGVMRAAGTTPTPEADAMSADVRQYLEQALDRMEDPYRSIVILREIQGLKYQEISEALELPLNTVKVYLHRARKTLRDVLSEVTHREPV